MNLDFQVNNKLSTYFNLFPCDTQVEREKKNNKPLLPAKNVWVYKNIWVIFGAMIMI